MRSNKFTYLLTYLLRLSLLSVGFRTHLKSMQFHSFHSMWRGIWPGLFVWIHGEN